MSWQLFAFLYVIYILALIVGYRYLIKHIEKKKLKKKLEQAERLQGDENV